MIHILLNVFTPAETLPVGFRGSVMHTLFLSRPEILVGPQISIFLVSLQIWDWFQEVEDFTCFMLEGEIILVGRKIKVAICSFEVDHLSSSEGCIGLFVKIYFQSPQARNHHQYLFGQPACGASRVCFRVENVCLVSWRRRH